MARYSSSTTVAVSKTRGELEALLKNRGAEGFGYAWKGRDCVVSFQLNGRLILYRIPMPDRADVRFTHSPAGRCRKLDSAHAAWEQSERQIWRALLLVVRAKIEAVEAGISTIEQEFLAWTSLPNGSTVHEWLEPQIATLGRDGKLPKLIAAPRSSDG